MLSLNLIGLFNKNIFFSSLSNREPAIVIGNILCAKTILLILYGRKVYEISVHRQESRNLAVLSQFTSKCMQPSLHNFPNNRTCTGSSVFTTDLDSNNSFETAY